jgi:RecJ-like exonuclease
MRTKEFIPATKPRNFVAKNQKTAGAGAHKDKKKAEKQGDLKHKNKQFEQGVAEGSESDAYGNTGEKHECGSCDGTGIDTYDDECPECGGKGWVRDKESLKKKGVADEGVLSFLKTEPEKKKWNPAKDSRVTGNKQDNEGWIKLLIDKHRRGIELTDREWNSIEQWKLKRAMGAESTQVQELSTDLLGRYKKAAGDDATAADKAGDYDKGHKRFKGIVKATNKQFDNDAKERK